METSDQTKKEMEQGAKQLAENQEKIDAAMKARAAEEASATTPPVDEAQKAVDEAKPLMGKSKKS